MFRKIISWVIILVFAVVFSILGYNLPTYFGLTDAKLEQEKQYLYELKESMPKDIEQALEMEDVSIDFNSDFNNNGIVISFNEDKNIIYKFNGDYCSLTTTYDTKYNILKEEFKDLRITCYFTTMLGLALGVLIGIMVNLLRFKIEDIYDKNKYKRNRKKEERLRKKQEKQKAKNIEIKVIQQ